jgi:hypothetical protein
VGRIRQIYTLHKDTKNTCNAILKVEPWGSSKPAWAIALIFFLKYDCQEILAYTSCLLFVVLPMIANIIIHQVLIHIGSSCRIIMVDTLK